MHRSRPTTSRTVALVAISGVLALAVLAGCGHGKRSSSATPAALAGPAGAASPASAGVTGTGAGGAVASTTAGAGVPGASPGAAPAGSDAGSSTAATNAAGDTAAPASDPAAAGDTTPAVADGQPAPPPSAAAAGAALVRQIFARLYSYTLSDPEVACIDRNIPVADLRAIDAAGDADPGNAQIIEIAQALARCEPTAFVDDQAALLVEADGITGEQAACIGRGADQLAVADPKIATVLLDDWAQLAAGASRDQLVAAVATCVDHDTAVTIVTG